MPIRRFIRREAISPPDTTAPSVPANLREIDKSDTAFSVLWDASTDNRSVLGYEVEINGALEAGLNQSTGYVKSGLVASTTYPIKVRAVDNSLNRSAYTSAINITTTGSGGGGGDSLVPAPDTSIPDLYVHPSGVLAGNAAYTTIQAAINAASSGQKIAVGQATYVEKIHINKPLTIRAWDPANRPLVDGQFTLGQWTGVAGSAALVSINASNVTWDGINITRPAFLGMQIGYCKGNGYFTQSGDPDVNYSGGTAVWYENINVLRTEIYEWGNIAVTMLYVRDIYFGKVVCRYGSALKNPYLGDYLENNNYTWPPALSAGGDGLTFVECDIYQTLTEGWHFGLWYMNVVGSTPGAVSTAWLHTKNLTMTKCRVWDCWSAGLYLGDVDTGTIDRCLFYKTTDTIYWHYASLPSSRYPAAAVSLASESGRSSNFRSYNGLVGAKDVTFKNCVFTGAATLFNCEDSSNGFSHDYLRIKVLNCTFFSVNQGALWANDRGCLNLKHPSMRDWTFKNNLIYDSEGMVYSSSTVAPVGTTTIGYNLWSHTRPTGWTGTGDIVNSSVGLTNGTYLINNNFPSAPDFDTTAFTIVGTSPAVNSGTTDAGVTNDFFGKTRPGGVLDIGAHSYR